MGRPKGSKNKPKVEKISKTKGNTIDPLEIVKNLERATTIKNPLVEEPEPEEDEDEPTLEEALKDLGGEGEVVKKQRGLKQKKMKEQIDFLLEEVTHLRLFVCRVEDMMLAMLKRYPITDTPIPELKKTRGKIQKQPQLAQSQPLTNPQPEESKNETEIVTPASI